MQADSAGSDADSARPRIDGALQAAINTALRTSAREIPYAHGYVDVQSACGHVQGSAHRDHNATAHTYEGIPGLIRKYYGIAPDGSSLVGIYLWESKAAASAFYTGRW
jgi:hypothetical protein